MHDTKKVGNMLHEVICSKIRRFQKISISIGRTGVVSISETSWAFQESRILAFSFKLIADSDGILFRYMVHLFLCLQEKYLLSFFIFFN